MIETLRCMHYRCKGLIFPHSFPLTPSSEMTASIYLNFHYERTLSAHVARWPRCSVVSWWPVFTPNPVQQSQAPASEFKPRAVLLSIWRVPQIQSGFLGQIPSFHPLVAPRHTRFAIIGNCLEIWLRQKYICVFFSNTAEKERNRSQVAFFTTLICFHNINLFLSFLTGGSWITKPKLPNQLGWVIN